jgi:hypothetical protein
LDPNAPAVQMAAFYVYANDSNSADGLDLRDLSEKTVILAAHTAKGAELTRYAPDPFFKLGGWKGKTGLWHPETWGGNGATGGRLKFAEEASEFAGHSARRLFYVGSAFAVYDMGRGLASRDGWAVAQGGADLGAGAAGEFGGPLGWAFAGGYFAGRSLDDALNISGGIAYFIEQPVQVPLPQPIFRGSL